MVPVSRLVKFWDGPYELWLDPARIESVIVYKGNRPYLHIVMQSGESHDPEITLDQFFTVMKNSLI